MLNKKTAKNETDPVLQVQYNKQASASLARLINKRKQHFENELKAHPPEPPWAKHPGYSRSDKFWRTGAGSQYLMDYIWPYNRYSTKEARQQYRNIYPEPVNWRGWYSE